MNERIKAVVLAGGMGTRLMPITCTIPKPLAPVLGESVLKHLLRLIAGCGISEATLTTMYLPEKIRDQLGDSFSGVELNYINEEKPKGTAGGVKDAAAGTSKDILVMSGDGICDFELKHAMEFHFQKNADVTIVTYRAENPLEYGVVCSEEDGRIYEFREKPPWAQVSSNQINTGIYLLKNEILDDIPDEGSFDFSKNLFPLLMERGKSLYAYSARGFWCDIGDIDEYYKCNMTALEGGIANLHAGEHLNQADFDLLGCRAIQPVWVSRQASVAREATIGPFTIIGKGCSVAGGAKIEHSILHERISVGKKTVIQSAIICDRAKIGDNCRIKSGCVIGSDSDIGSGTALNERTRLHAGERVYRMNGTCFKDQSGGLFCNDGIYLGVLSNLGAETCTRIGSSLGRTLLKLLKNNGETGRIGVMHDGGDRAELACDLLLCGVKSAGVRSFHFGSGFLAMANFAAVSFITDLVLYVSTDSQARCTIRLIDKLSLPVSRSFERTFEGVFSENKEFIPEKLYDTELFDGLKFLYYSELLKSAGDVLGGESLGGLCCAVRGEQPGFAFSPEHMLKRALSELSGQPTPQRCALEAVLSADGRSAELSDQGSGTRVDLFHMNAILLYDAAKNGAGAFALPYLSPEIYRTIARQAKCAVTDYLYFANRDNSVPRELIRSQLWLNDGVFACLRFLALMKRKDKTVAELLREVPRFEVYTGDFDEESDRAQVMSDLSKREADRKGAGEREGIRLAFTGGRVTVIPKRQGGFRLISEAESYEMAKELCGEAIKQLKESR